MDTLTTVFPELLRTAFDTKAGVKIVTLSDIVTTHKSGGGAATPYAQTATTSISEDEIMTAMSEGYLVILDLSGSMLGALHNYMVLNTPNTGTYIYSTEYGSSDPVNLISVVILGTTCYLTKRDLVPLLELDNEIQDCITVLNAVCGYIEFYITYGSYTTTYKADLNMKYSEWLASDYNTTGYTSLLLDGVTLADDYILQANTTYTGSITREAPSATLQDGDQ